MKSFQLKYSFDWIITPQALSPIQAKVIILIKRHSGMPLGRRGIAFNGKLVVYHMDLCHGPAGMEFGALSRKARNGQKADLSRQLNVTNVVLLCKCQSLQINLFCWPNFNPNSMTSIRQWQTSFSPSLNSARPHRSRHAANSNVTTPCWLLAPHHQRKTGNQNKLLSRSAQSKSAENRIDFGIGRLTANRDSLSGIHRPYSNTAATFFPASIIDERSEESLSLHTPQITIKISYDIPPKRSRNREPWRALVCRHRSRLFTAVDRRPWNCTETQRLRAAKNFSSKFPLITDHIRAFLRLATDAWLSVRLV